MRKDTKQKVLLLLSAGLALGLSRSPKNYFKILESVAKGWKDIKLKRLYRIVHEFYQDRLVDYKENEDGIVKIVLTKEGRQKALQFQIDDIKIRKPKQWDGTWRMVIFDIPEKNKKAREALRRKIKELGFLELQKSVFVYPFECEDEINFIVEVFQIRPYVRFIRASSFTNEEQLKIKFGIY